MANEIERKSWLGFLRNHVKGILLTLLVVVLFVLASGAVVYYLAIRNNNDVLAVVGSEKITTSDLNKAIYSLNMQGTEDKPSMSLSDSDKKDLLEELIQKSIISQEATKDGVTVASSDVLKQIKAGDPQYDARSASDQKLIFDNTKANMLEDKMKSAVLTYNEGQYLLVRFDRYQAGPFEDQAKATTEKAQAETFVSQLYSDIKAGKLTFAQAQEKLTNDPVLGQPSYDAINLQTLLSGSLDQETYELGLGPTVMSDFNSLVDSTDVNQVSQPKILKVSYTDPSTNKTSEFDGAYGLVLVTKKHPGEATTFNSWLSLEKSKYLTPASFLDKYLYPNRVYAGLAGSGGLVPSGDSSPAGFFIMFNYYDAAGGRHQDFKARAIITNSSNSSYSWSGASKSCSTSSIVYTTGTDSFRSSKTFYSPDPSGNSYGQGWILMGYDSKGGNGYSLICSCKYDYTASFSNQSNNSNYQSKYPDSGHWDSISYYFTNGTKQYYPMQGTNHDQRSFSAIDNGYTAGMYVNYQANRPPVTTQISPTCGQQTTLAAGTTTTSLPLTVSSSDADGDSLTAQAQYCKVDANGNCNGSTTTTAWVAVPNNGTTTQIATTTVLDAGTYKWMASVSDGKTTYSTSWCTFTINTTPPPPTGDPICTLNANPNPINAGGATALNWVTNSNTTSATIDNGIGSVATGTNSKSGIAPATTTTYTMTATNSTNGHTYQCSTTVNVLVPSLSCSVVPTSGQPVTTTFLFQALNYIAGLVKPVQYQVMKLGADGATWSVFDGPLNPASGLDYINYNFSAVGTYKIQGRGTSPAGGWSSWADCGSTKINVSNSAGGSTTEIIQ